MCVLGRVVTVRRLSIVQRSVEVSFYPVLCDIPLLRSISPPVIIPCVGCVLLLLSSESYVGVALNIESEGDENVANDGGDDADKRRPLP